MRLTIKNCKVQVDFINNNILKSNKVRIQISGIWKNIYFDDRLIVTARTYSECYYQLVAFKNGLEIRI